MGRNSFGAEACEQQVLETDLFLLVSSYSELEPPWLYLISENYGACYLLAYTWSGGIGESFKSLQKNFI